MSDPVPQYLRDHARTLQKRPIFIADCTMRYGSEEGLTLLALKATDGRCDYPALLAEAREIVASGNATDRPPIDVVGMSWVARVMGGQPGPTGDFAEAADLTQALRILRAGRRLEPGQGLPGDIDRLEAQTNIAAGRLSYVEQVIPELVLADETRWMLDTELMHPDNVPGGEEAWLQRFNWIFESAGLSPIRLEPGDGNAFDRVVPTVSTSRSADDRPVVSVVMSVFKPDQSLLTALRSLAAQTYQNLQVLVVDDCSPAESQAMIEEAVALDDRFELHRMPVNGGTYKIRNYAISVARGDFITFQDSDDWSHPERIERQMLPLLAEPGLVASLSRSVRAYENLSVNKIGYAPLRVNSSSLLMRRDPVVTELGGFDEVRKGADSEFLERLEKHFGQDRIETLEDPLALVQLTHGSLSRTDFLFGWRDGNRVAYRQAYEHFHNEIALGNESIRIEPGAPRRFPVPLSFTGPRPEGAVERDVVVMSDWRAGQPRYVGADDEVRALVDAGLEVGLLQAEIPRYAARPRISPARSTMLLVQDGRAVFDRWEEPLHAGLAYVRDPELLCYPRRVAGRAVAADAVVISAGYPPRAPEDASYVYDPVTAEDNAAKMFGGDVVWQPATAEIAAALKADGAQARIADPGHLGVVPGRRRAYAGVRGTRPIVGTTGMGGMSPDRDRPTVGDLVRLFPDDDAYDVRIRDPLAVIGPKRHAKGLPANWLLSRETPLEEFVDQLDIFVGLPRRTWGPDLSHEIAVAAARGCVLLLPPTYEQHLGDAAIYAEESAVPDVARRLWQDPEGFIAQQQRGYAWAEQMLSPEAFRQVLIAASGIPLADRRETP